MRLTDLDLNLLVPLEALLVERNISRAAVRVGVSQSAMSKTLSRLRAGFGDELLVRAGQEYCLSPFAEELVPELQEVLSTLEKTLNRRPRFRPDADKVTFRIAAIDALEHLILNPLVDRIAVDAPGVALELHAVRGESTLDELKAGELDLCLTAVTYQRNDLVQQSLFDDRRVCAVWSGLGEVGDVLTFEQLMRLPHIAYDWAGFDRQTGEFPEWRYLDQLPVRVKDEHLLLRLLMLRGTNFVTFTWEALANGIAPLADIRVVEPPFPSTPIPQRMVWHPRSTTDPAHMWLRAQLDDIARRVPGRGAHSTPGSNSHSIAS